MAVDEIASDEWWTHFHVAEMADLFLERADAAEMEKTVHFLIRSLQLKSGDRVFDQCCGIANVSIALARCEMQCVGVDLCRVYIDRAVAAIANSGTSCEVFCDDALTFVPERICDGAFNWYSSFGYAPEDARNSLMARRAFESLRPGGIYAIEMPNFVSLIRNFQQTMVRKGTNAQGLDVTCVRESRLDLVHGLLHQKWQWMVEGRPVDNRFSAIRIYLPHQLVEMLEQIGFAEIQLFGGIDESPVTMDGPRLIVTARRPA